MNVNKVPGGSLQEIGDMGVQGGKRKLEQEEEKTWVLSIYWQDSLDLTLPVPHSDDLCHLQFKFMPLVGRGLISMQGETQEALAMPLVIPGIVWQQSRQNFCVTFGPETLKHDHGLLILELEARPLCFWNINTGRREVDGDDVSKTFQLKVNYYKQSLQWKKYAQTSHALGYMKCLFKHHDKL